MVNSLPVKRHYTTEELFDWTGVSLTVTYGDGRTYEVEGYKLGLLFVVENHLNMAVAGPRRLTPRYMGRVAASGNAEATFDVFVFRSEAMRDWVYEVHSMSGGGSAGDVINVRVPPGISVDDLEMQYTGTIFDQLGGLFIALNGRFARVDMSEAELGFIPGSTLEAFSFRQSLWPNNIRGITLPPNITSIGTHSFRSSFLGHLDLGGQEYLTEIGEFAFALAGISTVNFDGSIALERIANLAFAQNSIQYVDLANTGVQRIMDWAFITNNPIRWIEFPPTLTHMSDYAMQNMPNLEYVRFRGHSMGAQIGWSNFLYFWQGASNRTPFVQRIRGFSDSNDASGAVDGRMTNYILFHPNTLGYHLHYGSGWFFSMDGRDTPVAHRVPLPFDPSTVSGYSPHVDALRGDALLDYIRNQEQDMPMGNSAVNIQFNGLNNLNGMIVRSNVSAVTGNTTIANGSLNLTIGIPSAGEMQQLNQITAQQITGRFQENSRFLWYAYRPQNMIEWTITNAGNNTRTGRYGKPVVWPDGQGNDGGTAVNFVMLELMLENAAGAPQGRLERWGRSQHLIGTNVSEEVTVIRYVYVDQDTVIHRSEDQYRFAMPMRHVWMTLYQGWNRIEAKENFTWNIANETSPGVPNAESSSNLGFIFITVSGGIMSDDSGGRVNITNNPPAPSSNIPFVPVPWTLRTDDAFEDITSQPLNLPGGTRPPEWESFGGQPLPNFRSSWRVSQ